MSRRGLFVLSVLFAVSLGFVVWFDRPGGTQDKKGTEEILLEVSPEQVERVDLRRGPVRILLEKEAPRRWRMVEPVRAEADSEQVDRLLESVKSVRVSRVIEEKATEVARFGLAPAEAELRLEAAGGKTLLLGVGRLSPVGFERYATVGDGKVVLVDGAVGTALLREAEEFRQKRLVPIEAEHVRRILLARDGERIVLEREGGDWRLLEPVRDLGEAAACDSLARALSRLSLARLADPDRLRELIPAFARPSFTAEVRADPEGSFLVQVAGEEGKTEWLARRAASTVAGWIRAADVKDVLTRKARDLREKRLVFASSGDILEIAIEGRGRSLVLKRSKEADPWRAEDGSGATPLDTAKVEDFLDRLRWIRATPVDSVPPSLAWELSVRLAGSSGELGRLEIGPEYEETGEDGREKRRHARSSWRPGFLFSFASESLGPVPSSAADLAATDTKGSHEKNP